MDHWAHLDIAGVMDGTGGVAYLGKGMTGMGWGGGGGGGG